ncbi:hypothetical protein EQM14_11245 [Caproiciproducens sp. NJN-50]|uniref:hypothetical protein n=1 Tax=Acutalibacteraceae TaxID=3082771 RepID=UPI000FFE09EB|nr:MULTISPECIES: hypothetical protein [Acutalibacteraceae]QAT50288.1 hypothetical protein EQM14_11245 [Caproiciproducens sp. NJN-50]
MKRIISACLEQTIHFQLKEDVGHDAAVRSVKEELDNYKVKLERNRTKYKIVEEVTQPDESVVIKIKKQYNNHDCGEYLA